MTKIGFGGGKGKPQVGYPTAMDIYVVICLMSVFAALCEFAIINFISVTLSRRKEREQEMKEAEEKAKELIETAGKVDRQQQKDRKTSPGDPPLIVVNVCIHFTKGQEISKGIFDVFISPKIRTKIFERFKFKPLKWVESKKKKAH